MDRRDLEFSKLACVLIMALLLIGASLPAEESNCPASLMDENDMKARPQEFSPYANRGIPTNVYFGETHLHTTLSTDAGAIGNRLGMEEAYRFCGEKRSSARPG